MEVYNWWEFFYEGMYFKKCQIIAFFSLFIYHISVAICFGKTLNRKNFWNCTHDMIGCKSKNSVLLLLQK